jgi:hypothetical protein
MFAKETATLRPRLEAARKALDAALEEACAIDAQDADAADLLRLEEQLTAAREAASNVIAALRHLGPEAQDAEVPLLQPHRFFVDDRGVQWDAFAVYPSRPKGKETLPAPYTEGWLAIQCPECVKRVTPIPERWRECSPDEFGRILKTATESPRRAASRREGRLHQEREPG